ncbi:glutaredoxin [Amylocystis lapponica]|nr:glutaredoxin [Amylocystis lapponica]
MLRLYRGISSSVASYFSSPTSNPRRLMAVKDTVEAAIADNKITIFSKTWCPYCKRAKGILTSSFPDASTKILELDELDEGSAIQQYLKEKTGQNSVPNIFINQQHVGGCDSVVALESQGKLASLVAA